MLRKNIYNNSHFMNGNGLVLDKETMRRLQTLSGMYVGEDLLAATENLHSPQATEKREVGEVM